LWEKTRARGIPPTFAGNLSDDVEKRLDFLEGARLMGYDLVDLDDEPLLNLMKSQSPRRYPIQPQQLWIADALNAPNDEYIVEIVRRAGKTTTIFCLLLGRCARRANYYVTFSAQSGVKGTARLREWKRRLDAINPPDDLDLPPWLRGRPRVSKRHQTAVALFGEDVFPTEPELTAGRGFKIMMGEVAKGIYFDNGSQFLVFKPDAEAYRGEAADVSWIDEAQEIDPEVADDLLAGIVPLQDTRDDDAAIILSGTAGEARVGPMWTMVERIRAGDTTLGGIDYCAPEDTLWEDVEDEERAMAILKAVHPGIGTLTTWEKMRKSWHKLTKPKWAREYLSMWPKSKGAVVISPEQWEAGIRKGRRPPLPARVAFGVAIKPGGSVAAVCAAWRNASGQAFIEVIQHLPGTDWVPDYMQQLTKAHRGATVAYDDIGEGKATATEAQLLTPRPRLKVQTYSETAAGCVQIMRDLARGKLTHFDQAGLNVAVRIAAKREVRNDKGLWLWTVTDPTDDITPLDAATKALRNWDQHFARRTTGTTPIMGK
jgi:hypothetical protein